MMPIHLETEIIDKLFLELRQISTARTPDELKYDKLIYAVVRKFPGEERFETALRYITEAESKTGDGKAKQVKFRVSHE